MQAWSKFLLLQEEHFGKESIDKWLRPLKVVHFDSANLYLEAPSSFEILWFEEHIRPIIKKSFFNDNGRLIKVHVSTSESLQSVSTNKKKAPPSKEPPLVLSTDTLDPNCSLDQFLCGKNNALILQFLTQLLDSIPNPSEAQDFQLNKAPQMERSQQISASKPTPEVFDSDQNPLSIDTEYSVKLGTFNPIVFYGSAGVGKTHLLMALTAAFQKKKLKALYVRTETFTEHVVKAIRTSQMHPFRDHYRNNDILLFDDIHVLAKRLATQEELFHTFNALHMAGKQLIFTSNLPPSQLEEIEPRLISRFEWGIQLHMEPLDKELLKTFLIQKSSNMQCSLEEDAIDYILQSLPSRPNSVHKALDTLILHTHLSHNSFQNPISKETAEKILKNLIEAENSKKLTSEKIIASTAAYFGIRTEDILGKSQIQEFSFARQIAIHLCRERLKIPFMKIGGIFSKDHSTVMTSVKNIQKLLDQLDPETCLAVNTIQKKFELE